MCKEHTAFLLSVLSRSGYDISRWLDTSTRGHRVSEACTFFFSDFCLQVLGVNIDKILLFWTFALPAAKTAAAETAAAGENAAAHHKSLNMKGGIRNNLKLIFSLVVPADFLNPMLCSTPWTSTWTWGSNILPPLLQTALQHRGPWIHIHRKFSVCSRHWGWSWHCWSL